jgi:hypothetical protein
VTARAKAGRRVATTRHRARSPFPVDVENHSLQIDPIASPETALLTARRRAGTSHVVLALLLDDRCRATSGVREAK